MARECVANLTSTRKKEANCDYMVIFDLGEAEKYINIQRLQPLDVWQDFSQSCWQLVVSYLRVKSEANREGSTFDNETISIDFSLLIPSTEVMRYELKLVFE